MARATNLVSIALVTALTLGSPLNAVAGGTDTYLFINGAKAPVFFWVFNNGWSVGSTATATEIDGVKHMYYVPACSFTHVKKEDWQNSGFPPTVKVSVGLPSSDGTVKQNSNISSSSGVSLSASVKASIKKGNKSATATGKAAWEQNTSSDFKQAYEFTVGKSVVPSTNPLIDPNTASWDGSRKLVSVDNTNQNEIQDNGYSMYYGIPSIQGVPQENPCEEIKFLLEDDLWFKWNTNFGQYF